MLANEPALVLADEPTGNLDPNTRRQVLDLLADFNSEGRAVVLVTHDPVAAAAARRVWRLQAGAVAEGSAAAQSHAA
jgi:putative ABC transport system ATP-binding protein